MNPQKPISCLLVAVALLATVITPSSAGENPPAANHDGPPGKPYVYKTSAGEERSMEIYFPQNHDLAKAKVLGLILFHGGGWKRGNPSQFRTACAYFASRGLVCATVEYQLPDQNAIKGMPAGQSYKRLCITDAKSAIRWFKTNATKLGIDPDRIITGGGSAGAHISAIATHALGLDDPTDPKDIDTRVVAYLWFNPAFSPEDHKDPAINILSVMKPGLPPALAIFGDKDEWLKGWTEAHRKWKSLGVESIGYLVAPNEGHGFFNQPDWHPVALIAADDFLVKHGLLTGKATLTPPAEDLRLHPAP